MNPYSDENYTPQWKLWVIWAGVFAGFFAAHAIYGQPGVVGYFILLVFLSGFLLRKSD